MTTEPFGAWLASRRKAIDDHLLRVLPPSRRGRLAAAMRYSVVGAGKRLRPLMCVGAAESLGAKTRSALPCACALELVHCYSLIHDDLPAMDDDDLRRGKPSCHVRYGEATAILAGTSLLTLAFGMLAGEGGESVCALARAAGHEGMNEGQMRDLEMTGGGDAASSRSVLAMHRLKTGMLFGASLELGALCAGASPKAVAAMRKAGDAVGKHFQIVDDVIDEGGGDIGKTPGKDRRQDKPSIVVSQGMHASLRLARRTHAQARRELERSAGGDDKLLGLLDMAIAPLARMAHARGA